MKNCLVIEISEDDHKKITVYYISKESVSEKKIYTSFGNVWKSHAFFDEITINAIKLFPRSEYNYKQVFYILPNFAITQDLLRLPIKISRFSVAENIRSELRTLHDNFKEMEFAVSAPVKTSRSLLYYSYGIPQEIFNFTGLSCSKQGLKCAGLTFRSKSYADIMAPHIKTRSIGNLFVWIENRELYVQFIIQGQLMGFYSASVQNDDAELEKNSLEKRILLKRQKLREKFEEMQVILEHKEMQGEFVETQISSTEKVSLDMPTDEEENDSEDVSFVNDENVHGDELEALVAFNALTFLERQQQIDEKTKNYLFMLEQEFSKYIAVVSRTTNKAKCFYERGKLIAKISLVSKELRLHLALPIEDFDPSIFQFVDLSATKTYHEVPLTIKVNSSSSFKRARVLICEALGNRGVFSSSAGLDELKDLFGFGDENENDDDFDDEEENTNNVLHSETISLNKLINAIDTCMEYARTSFSGRIDAVFLCVDKEVMAVTNLEKALNDMRTSYTVMEIDKLNTSCIARAW